jgi:hypothetical protein
VGYWLVVLQHFFECESEASIVAQGLIDSLILLASLRPRSSKGERSSLIPPPSLLHKLHRTLPFQATQGWLGTLPPSKSTSLRDDSAIHIKAGVTIPIPPANPTPTPATTNSTSTNPVASQTYPSAFTYPPFGSQPYRGGYAPYKPGQTSSAYYPGYPQHTQGQGQQQTQGQTSASYYGSQYPNTSGHQQYSYSSSWYNYQPQAPVGAADTTSNGRGTPQPASVPATNYAGFFGSPAQPGLRAVANTVTSNKQPWSGTGSPPGYAPTLPSHLRSAVSPASQPTIPVSGAHQHYGTYVTAPAAR